MPQRLSRLKVVGRSRPRSDERRAVSPAVREICLPPPFGCEVIPERDRVRIAPSGELDLSTAPELERTTGELWAAGFTHVVLDLREVCFLDVAGVRVILALDAAARADGSTFELIPGPAQVQRVFDLTGVHERVSFQALPRLFGTAAPADGRLPAVVASGWPR